MQKTYLWTCAFSKDSESSLTAFWIAKDDNFPCADNKDYAPTARKSFVFVGSTVKWCVS